MKHPPALLLGLALAGTGCKSHTHAGFSVDEKVEIDLTVVR